jgi:hypothetical protein
VCAAELLSRNVFALAIEMELEEMRMAASLGCPLRRRELGFRGLEYIVSRNLDFKSVHLATFAKKNIK